MYSLVTLRNRHFLEAARRVLSTLPAGRPVSLEHLASLTALEPAPSYYCTFEYALRMLRVLRHGRLKLRNDRRLALWEELNMKCTVYMARTGCNLPEALGYILASESASQFFIAPSTALRLVQRLRSASAAARS